MREPSPEQIKAWTDRADKDLRIAKGNLEMGFYDACAVYCEQAVEKYLKALYMATEKREPPKTHHVVTLATDLGMSETEALPLHKLELDYMAARYPDVPLALADEYNAANATERMGIAERAIAWVKERLQPEEAANGGS